MTVNEKDEILVSLDEISFILRAALNASEIKDTEGAATGIVIAVRSLNGLKSKLENEKDN